MLRRKKKGNSGDFQVAITVIEVKHLPQNSNTVVIVKLGKQKKKTIIRQSTDNPYYNEYFVLSFTGDFDVFLNKRIHIGAYLKRSRRLKLYGGIFIEVATVWDQPDHEFYHKWAMLTNPKDPTSGPKGYVKCNIAVNAKGSKIPVHPAIEEDENDIEGNLLIPSKQFLTTKRQTAEYEFIIYRADGLSSRQSSLYCGNFNRTINPFIQISFAGMKGKTSWKSCTSTPHFNETIIFTEMFPPLSYRIKIAIKDKVHGCRSRTLATHTLNLARLSNSGEYVFLPTYGPSFIHFYESNRDCECCCSVQCHKTQPIYQGRVLLSLKTQIDNLESSVVPQVATESIAPIIENNLWTTQEYLLVGVLYDVCMIDRCKFSTKSISFEMNFGNAGSRKFPHGIENISSPLDDEVIFDKRPDFESHTVPRLTATTDGKFNYLPLGSSKPCMYIKSWWPNFQWRVSNTNSLTYIFTFLKENLVKLESSITIKDRMAYEIYNGTIRTLSRYCMHYLNILDTEKYNEDGGTTKLDRHRINLCRESIEDIVSMIKINGDLPNNNYIKIAMTHAYKYLHKIHQLVDDPQHAFPDVFIWMMAGTRRVALARLSASQIIYSEEMTSRGAKCGQRVNLFMKNIGEEFDTVDYSACKIEIFLWLGNCKFASACWSSIPAGYEVHHYKKADSFPKSLVYTCSSKFQLRAHIFQGRFDSGLDTSGLMDPYIRIIFHGYTATTQIIKQTLAPVWDETLIFPPIDLHGVKADIKLRPSHIIMEAFDWDFCGSNDFCGRCNVIPVVKLLEETYAPPEFPPTLTWHKLEVQKHFHGSILAAFELIETGDEVVDLPLASLAEQKLYNLPDDIRPVMRAHRLEVVFWGVRDMKKINGIYINKPRIVVECSGIHVKSEVINNAKKFSNFHQTHLIVDLDLPELSIYYPPIIIKAYDARSLGRFVYAGVCIIPSIHIFLEELLPQAEYHEQIYKNEIKKIFFSHYNSSVILPLSVDYHEINPTNYKELAGQDLNSRIAKFFALAKMLVLGVKSEAEKNQTVYGNEEDENYDWWSKYFASLEEQRNIELGLEKIILPDRKPIATFKIYPMELELQPEFRGFQDRLRTFELSKGKKTGDPERDRKNFTGKFKGRIGIYPWPHRSRMPCRTKTGRDISHGLFIDYPSQEPTNILVRLYVIKGIRLHPCDPHTGKSDPYLMIKLGNKVINDKKNYIPNQLNPTFGRCFEIEAQFPRDHTLIIQVWDHDATSADDLIGETKIDIENRFYSDHRGQCGIAKTYSKSGYNAWRDRDKPTQILDDLCKINNLPLPEFTATFVKIGKQKFPFLATLEAGSETDREEYMALNVLHQWQHFPVCGVTLVPEHIERRALFNTERPGLEQGKLELWVDMFRVDDLPLKPPIDITPQVPEEYELRVIILNTEDVPLVDNQFLTGEKCSDIYVKGWLVYEDHQKTDVHYNSLTGEGNFNWRFIFPFTYSKTEHLMIVRKKLSMFSMDETEQKLPCKLNLQVWDSDHFSPDDFLGALTMDLFKMPRGSANSKNCTLKVTHPQSPTVNLFKAKRMKAWWPLSNVINTSEHIQAGKVEMELILMNAQDAAENPVGRGRDPPEPLAYPNRPDTSFSWFRNPWKACCFVVCRYYRWRIIFCALTGLFVALVLCAVYAFPGYLVKKILRA